MFLVCIFGSSLLYSQDYSEEGLSSNQEIYIEGIGILQMTAINLDKEMKLESLLQFCKNSVLEIVDDKIYLNPGKLLIFKGNYLLENDQQQWMQLNEVFKDNEGFYLYVEPKCPKGHMGFRKVGVTWYCLDDECPYCYYKNFK